jgi:hypothetical protein
LGLFCPPFSSNITPCIKLGYNHLSSLIKHIHNLHICVFCDPTIEGFFFFLTGSGRCPAITLRRKKHIVQITGSAGADRPKENKKQTQTGQNKGSSGCNGISSQARR